MPRPEVFYDPRALEADLKLRACLHANFIVVDRPKIPSVNFTEAARQGQAVNRLPKRFSGKPSRNPTPMKPSSQAPCDPQVDSAMSKITKQTTASVHGASVIAPPRKEPFDFWHQHLSVSVNNFKFKSLSQWACNISVGCAHACRFCYVPSAATRRQAATLKQYGVTDPDAQWGEYSLLRTWDKGKFLASLNAAKNTPKVKLKVDGNRAVIFCSTTDP